MSAIYHPLQIDSEEITPKERKLKATWSYEAAQDLAVWHCPSLEDELAKSFAREIQREIDSEIIQDIGAAIMEELDEEIMRDIARQAKEIAENEFRWKVRKKKIVPRSITDDWEVSRFD